jgi:3-deoxy-D-manno-octulosonic-acid transferase
MRRWLEMYLVYSLLYRLIVAALLPLEYKRRPKGLRWRWLKERFGYIDSCNGGRFAAIVWVHTVSMGEVLAAVPFVKRLKERHPSLGIVLTTVTDTGQKVANERLSGIASISYAPFDLASVVKRFLRRMRPSLFITIETELWPNTFMVFRNEGIPVFVMNGRISDRSFRGYRKIRFFMRDVLKGVAMICMQSEAYAERIKMIGAPPEKVMVTGNFKFDTRPAETPLFWAGYIDGPVILAGSTHEGEEELIVSVYRVLSNEFPGLILILAPRHPERFTKVEEMLRGKGLSYIKRSDFGSPSLMNNRILCKGCVTGEERESTERLGAVSGKIIILDTVGELASAYSLCDIALIGGSFIRHGGQNPLEPAFWSKPVVCGPHMENFPFIGEFYNKGAAVATGHEGLAHILRELLRSHARRTEMGRKARALYEEKAGAVDRSLLVLERYLNIELPLA